MSVTEPTTHRAPVLAIDTSVRVAVGLADGDRIIATRQLAESRAHVELLTPTIHAVLAEAGLTLSDLSAIAIGMGPGPFTGLRVGIVTGWTLAETLQLPVHHLCGLDVIAAAWADAPNEFVTCLDARRKELYWARYRAGQRVGEPQVSAPGDLPEIAVIGPGVASFPDLLSPRQGNGPTELDPGIMALRAASLPDVGPTPLYLRRPDAAVATTIKSALPRSLRP